MNTSNRPVASSWCRIITRIWVQKPTAC